VGGWHWLTIVFMVDFVLTVLNMLISRLGNSASSLLLDQLFRVFCMACMKGMHLAEFMSVCPFIHQCIRQFI
jgi:hypothetical protein